MNIFYSDDTLYINLSDSLNDYLLNKLKKRVFNIIEDYDIENIVLNIISLANNDELIYEFINEYHNKYNGNLTIKNNNQTS